MPIRRHGVAEADAAAWQNFCGALHNRQEEG